MKKRQLWMSAAITLCVMLGGCAAGFNQSVYDFLAKADKGWSSLPDYERGKRYLQTGDYGLAIGAFDAELQRDPSSVRALNGKAIAYERLGRSDIAELYFEKALELDKDSPITLNNMAYLHLSHGDPDGALVLASRAKAALQTDTAGDETSAVVLHTVENNELLMRDMAEAAVKVSDSKRETAAISPIEKIDDRQWGLKLSKVGGFEEHMTRIQPAAPQEPEMLKPASASERIDAAVQVADIAPVLVQTPAADAKLETESPKPVLASKPTAAAVQVADTAPALLQVPAADAKLETETLKPVPASKPTAAAVQVADTAPAQVQAPVVGAKLRITNGSGRSRMARHLKKYLSGKGFNVGGLTNAQSFDHKWSVLYYRSDLRTTAEAVARSLPVEVKLVGMKKAPGLIELVAGSDLNRFYATLAEEDANPVKLAKQ